MAKKSTMDSDVVRAIRRVSNDLGHPPSQSEFLEYTEITEEQIFEHFADWDEASRFAGLKPHPETLPPTPKQLLIDWAKVVRKLGHIPTPNMYQREGSYKLRTIKKEVGTWPAIIEKFREFASGTNDWSDVLSFLPEVNKPKDTKAKTVEVNTVAAKAAEAKAAAAKAVEAKAAAVKAAEAAEAKVVEATAAAAKAAEAKATEAKAAAAKAAETKAAEAKAAEAKAAEAKAAKTKAAEPDNTKPQHAKPKSIKEDHVPKKEPEPMSQNPNPGSTGHSKLDDRPVFGDPINFRGLRHAPVNENGVVFIFGMVAHELGYSVEVIQAGFPNCEARRKIGTGKWQRVRIEFEYESNDFADKGHPTDGCDLIVCWNHNWTNCPEELEVVELASLVETL